MNEIKQVHALIPARGGSKGILRKNICLYRGLPLVAHSIIIAKQSKYISKIVVSTDDKEIAEIAVRYGAEVPFLRPMSISGDYSTDIECFEHYIYWLKHTKNVLPDVIVQLRPTYPERSLEILDDTIKTFLSCNDMYDSLRTVVPVEKSPFKMYYIKGKQLVPYFKKYKNIKEPYNHVRQVLPVSYLHNGYIDIVNRKTIEQQHSMTGKTIYPYVMDTDDILDIDTSEDMDKSLKSRSW